MAFMRWCLRRVGEVIWDGMECGLMSDGMTKRYGCDYDLGQYVFRDREAFDVWVGGLVGSTSPRGFFLCPLSLFGDCESFLYVCWVGRELGSLWVGFSRQVFRCDHSTHSYSFCRRMEVESNREAAAVRMRRSQVYHDARLEGRES